MIVTLTDNTPPIRDDGEPWTTAQLWEAAAQTGPFSLVQTYTLSPVDADPTNPSTHDFTTDAATIASGGWYQIVWVDASANQAIAPAIQNAPAARAWRPLVGDVAQLLRSRTVDTNGNQVGTFTADTQPTYEQASDVIDQVVAKLEAKFGPNMNPELVGSAAYVTALRAAMIIERGYFPDQVTAGRSIYPQLKEDYDEALADWLLERRSLGRDGTPDTIDDTEGNAMPVSTFPRPRNIESDATTGSGFGWEGVVW